MTTLVDPVVSPSSSPSLSPTRSRRLSSRRGSVSASDPWGVHSPLNNNPLRSTSSRLTIVRVPPPTEGEQYPRRHGRHGSNASLSSNSSAGKPEGSRMSFAFSSFGTSPGSGGPHGSSPTSSPRIRPQSPTLSRRYSGSMNKLPPEQLLDVARQACNPRVTNGGSPILPAEKPSSVSFTPLPDAILLPFVERPFEVGQLMCTPPSAKLFSLLAQMFPESTRAFTGKDTPCKTSTCLRENPALSARQNTTITTVQRTTATAAQVPILITFAVDMPPQPGIFPLPHSTAHKTRAANNADGADLAYHHQPAAGPSKTHGPSAEEQRREKRKRELMSKLGKDMTDRMDIGRHYAEVISDLHSTAIQLSTRPETLPAYHLRLYPLSLERSALLAALVHQEGHSLDLVQTAYEEEREEVEEEWRKGRERVRERLLESIEERRRRAREEKDGEGAVTVAGTQYA
ncbi:predicted protein [Postia placenta Mad-698-R]|nr:predicted protein [Postia placenta Mad-698-R]